MPTGNPLVKHSYLAAMAVALVFVLWMLSGLLGGSEEQGPAPSLAEDRRQQQDATEAAPVAVRVRSQQAEMQQRRLTVRGWTEAHRQVTVRAETGGLITELPVERGSEVEPGTVLCRIDPGSRPQRVAESEAAVALAELEFRGAQELQERGLQAATQIAAAEAEVARMRAQQRQHALDLERTRIRSPFAGTVERRPVELGDLLQTGGTCAEILDLDPLLLVGQVAEQDIGNLNEGASAQGQLLTGEQVEGHIRFIGRAADPDTRSFRVEVAVDNPDGKLRDGITTDILLPVARQPAHLIPSAILALDDAGDIGVRILDDDDRVRFEHVRIIGDDPEGLWVTGLPDQIRLIVVGQELVIPGQKVTPRPIDSDGSSP